MVDSLRQRARWAVTGVALLFAIGTVSAATWVQDGQPTLPEAAEPCNCPDIMGEVGGLGSWDRTPAGTSKSQATYGEYGGLWDGDRWEICEGASASQEDTLVHKYRKVSGSSNRWLRVVAISTPKYSGSAEEHTPSVPSSWWWTCSCVVHQRKPSASYKTSATGDPITISMEEIHSTDGMADGGKFGPNDPVTQPPSQPPPPPRTYPVPANVPHYPPNRPAPPDPRAGQPVTTSAPTTCPKSKPGYTSGNPHKDPLGGGYYWARSHEKISTNAKSITIAMTLDATAAINSDNVRVNDWKVALDVAFETELHASKPSEP